MRVVSTSPPSALATIGGVFLVAGLTIAAVFNEGRSLVFIIFLVTAGLVPLLAATALYLNEKCGWIERYTLEALLALAKVFLQSYLVTLLMAALIKTIVRPASVPAWSIVTIFVVCGGLLRFSGWPYSWLKLVQHLDAWLIGTVALTVFVFSPFDPKADIPVAFLDYANERPSLLLWLFVGIGWVAMGVWLRRREGWAFHRVYRVLVTLAALVVGLVILGLYDDSHYIDYSHYVPLVGPAVHWMRGGVPLVDTFSQYGLLPWVVHRAAFELTAPTFGASAVVVRLSNLGFYAITFCILMTVSRRRLSAAWFFIPAMIVQIIAHGDRLNIMWNLNGLPMGFGGRYFIPASMVLLLVVGGEKVWTNWLALPIIMIASLASVEQLAYTLGPWGACLVMRSVRRRSIKNFVAWVVLAIVGVVMTQIAFVASVYFSTGKIVDYGQYLDLVAQFRPSEESHWSVPIVPHYALWMPVGASFFLIISMSAYRALRGETSEAFFERLLPVAILGLCPMAYFFGRPMEPALSPVCMPFAVVIIQFAEKLFFNARRFGPVGPVLAAVVAASFAFIVADGLEHLMRPYDISRGNATFLRHCLTVEGCQPLRLIENIRRTMHARPLDPEIKLGYTSGGRPSAASRIEEVVSMLRRLAPEAHYVGLLTDYFPGGMAVSGNVSIGISALLTTGQWFSWGENSPFNDSRGPKITAAILERVDHTEAGLLVIVPNPEEREGWAMINQKIFDRLRSRCHQSLRETGQFFSAFVTERCR